MKTNLRILWVLTVFFVIVAAGYTYWNILDHGHVEWAGTVTILLLGGLTGFIAVYLGMTDKATKGILPEDWEQAEISDADGDLGHFSPWSWWPVLLAGAIAVVSLGVAISPWIAFLGLGPLVICLVGWVYEYYRGNFAK